MPWQSAQAIVTCDKVVSSASYCGDELRKPVDSRLFPSFFPTPRRIRRLSHPNLFLLSFRPKLTPSRFSSFLDTEKTGQDRQEGSRAGAGAGAGVGIGVGAVGVGVGVGVGGCGCRW